MVDHSDSYKLDGTGLNHGKVLGNLSFSHTSTIAVRSFQPIK